MCRVCAGAVFLLLTLVVCGQVTGSDVRAVPCIIGAPGQTGESAIILDQVPLGLSEYEVEVSLTDPSIGEITAVRFPSWAGLNSKSRVPSDSVIIKAADIGRKVYPGASEVVLAILTIRGNELGACDLIVKVLGMRDEVGSPYTVGGRNGTLSVLDPAGSSEDDPCIAPSPLPSATPFSIIPSFPIPTTAPPQENSNVVEQRDVTIEPTTSPTTGAGEPEENLRVNDTIVNPGIVCIDTIPGGAQVVVDDSMAGFTPTCIHLPGGIHHVYVVSLDGLIWNEDITVVSGQTLTVPTIMLEKPVYVIDVTAGPHGSVFPSGSLGVILGGSAEFNFVADPGYRLDEVQIDGEWQEPSSPILFESVSANHTLHGTFASLSVPVAIFSANVTDGICPLVVGFQSLSTGDISGMVWDFGDGTRSSEDSPVHVYDQPNNYSVSLEVCGEGGCNSGRREDMITVRAKEPPVTRFSANVTYGIYPLVVEFKSLSTGDILALFWNFGDDSISSESSPIHIYQDPGEYTVSLEVCRANGCDISRSESFIVVRENEYLKPNFSANTTEGQIPLMVQFEDLSTGGPGTWLWDFGDGGNSTEQSPAHLYVLPGLYTVTLEVANERYISTAVKEGMVNATPEVIGGSVGYLVVECLVEGARVFLDGQYQGDIINGTLKIPIYVTATPFRTLHVKADGFLPFSISLNDYPGEDETLIFKVPLVSKRTVNTTFVRFEVPFTRTNDTHILTPLGK